MATKKTASKKKSGSKKKSAAKKSGPAPEETVFLIDGSGYIFRAYYAVRRLSTSDGESTNAVFGFTNMLLRVLKEHAPVHLAIAFDLKDKTFRHEMYPEYKANRPPPPEDLPPQLPLIDEVVDAFRIPRLIHAGVEADDVLGTAAKKAKAAGYHVRIITGDKDLMQLVDDKVMLIDDLRNQRSNNAGGVMDEGAVREKFGVGPEHVVDVLALAGDSSDNIPGVKGIGEKTAAQLVDEYGDLESILKNAPNIKQKARRERLIDMADDARLSLKLVTIKDDVDMAIDLDAMRYEGPNKDTLRAIFERLEFKRLLNDPVVRDGDAAAPGPMRVNRPNKASRNQQDLFADDKPVPKVDIRLDRDRYVVVTEPKQLAAVAAGVAKSKRVALFCEGTTETGPGDLVGLAVAWGENEAAYIPVGHAGAARGEQLDVDDVRAALDPLLASGDREVVAHNGKVDITLLAEAGFLAFALDGDPMVASYLIDPDAGHGLGDMAARIFEHTAIPRKEVVGTGQSAVPLAETRPDKAGPYCAERADLALRLHDVMAPLVKEEGMIELYKELELPLERVLSKMERAGIKIDSAKLQALSKSFEGKLEDLVSRAHDAVGHDFNIGSPAQLQEILFKELKLKVLKRTKTGPSTDSSVLEQLRSEHALPGLILEWRNLAKLKNTYLDVLPELVQQKTGRVHSRFNQAVAATGRLSSENPNLQNIPVRTEIGRQIRDAFVAEPGHKLLSLDYSQIELRLLAHVSEDPVLIETFDKGEDVHQRTASEIFDVPLDDVTREQRTAAKAINFGLLYGMGVVRLSRELGIKRSEAKLYLEKYFERYAGIKQWHQTARDDAYATGVVRTLFGRRRKLPELKSTNRGEVARGERLATNTPIQGSAADLIKRAMLEADQRLADEKLDARLLLQVHDELLLEVPDAQVDKTREVVHAAMVGAAELKVPLLVEGAAGATWGDAH